MKKTTTTPKSADALSRAHPRNLRLVPLERMRVTNDGQRELRQPWVDKLTAGFDTSKFGTPEVSWRDDYFWIVDGQHRIEAAKNFLNTIGGWGDQSIECFVWEGLTETEEAELFIDLNYKLNINLFDKFRAAVKAGREMECEIVQIVESLHLHIARSKKPDSVGAIGTLIKVYRQCGPDTLERTLRIIRDAFGVRGFEQAVIDGIAKLCNRYNGAIDEAQTIASFSRIHAGLNGLLNQAQALRKAMSTGKADCIAAAACEVINRDRPRGKRLPDWFQAVAEAKATKKGKKQPANAQDVSGGVQVHVRTEAARPVSVRRIM